MRCPVCRRKLHPYMLDDGTQLTSLLSVGDLISEGDFYSCSKNVAGPGHLIAVFKAPVYLEEEGT